MSPAVLIAAVAGMAAAGAVVEMAALIAARRRAKGPGSAGSGAVPGRRPGVGAAGVRLLAALGRRIGLRAPTKSLAARVAGAGAPMDLSVGDVMAVKGGSALVALLGGAPIALSLPGRLPGPALVALPIAGFFAPDLWLARRARKRGRVMEAELPDLLDLLRVAVAAGLSLDRALAEVGERHEGRLAREWRTAAAELALGVPREEAHRGLLGRAPAPGMPAVVAALERADRHGAPLAETLAAQAREARGARARRIRDHAARAAPKIQLVVALLLVPSVLLLVGAALVGGLR
jgi:tight adherence protein C